MATREEGAPLSIPAIFAAARMIEESGCYICQPDNPDAADEGCGPCDADYWTAQIARLRQEDPPSDPGCYCGLRCFVGRGCH